MESTPSDQGKKRDLKNEEYLSSYNKHLEKRLRNLETEIQLLENTRKKLEKEVFGLRDELTILNEPAQITGTVIDVLDETNERIIIKSSTGPDYVVKVHKDKKNEKFHSGMEVSLSQRDYSILDILPSNIDPFVKGMELQDKVPDISYSDIGGLDDQIQEIRETVELPLLKPELYSRIGIDPPKGVLLHGPPGTGKTLLAKAVAHETNTTFIRVIASELVQKFIGEGARYVREIFEMARNKAPTILLIDELDAIAGERMEEATSGDREVQRTLMQLLSELDGFDNRGDVKIIGATNRIDILDRAILRPGRFDRIIEVPIPNEIARKSIFTIHMRNLNIEDDISIKTLVKMTEGTTGADIKAICTEAGMFAIRKDKTIINFEDFIGAISKIMKKKESDHFSSELFV